MWLTKNQNTVSNARASRSSGRNGILPTSRPDQDRSVLPRRHQGDLRARVAGTDDQDGPVAELRGAPELARVQLRDARIELGGEVRNPRPVVGTGGDHDLVGRVVTVVGGDPKAAAVIRRPDVGDAHARPHGELERGRVGLEVVGDLVLGRERRAGRRGTASPAGC